jgi:hypothetical protein
MSAGVAGGIIIATAVPELGGSMVDSAGIGCGKVVLPAVTGCVGATDTGVGVGDCVGGTGINVLGSTPGGTTITPGVPSRGGVTTSKGWSHSGVGVKIGAGVRVGTGGGAAVLNISPLEQPRMTKVKARTTAARE